MADALLHVANLGKRFGGFVALDGINLEVTPGERVGPDRPERLRQVDTRSTACAARSPTRPARCGSTATRSNGLLGAPAHPSRHGAQLPAAAAVRARSRSPTTCGYRCSTSAHMPRRPVPDACRAAALDERCAELLAPGRRLRRHAPTCRAISRRSRCASSSSRAPWRRIRSF